MKISYKECISELKNSQRLLQGGALRQGDSLLQPRAAARSGRCGHPLQSRRGQYLHQGQDRRRAGVFPQRLGALGAHVRSEEHTSELQSQR